VTAATLRLQGIVDELDQSFRGFVLTRNSRIRESWERASVELSARGRWGRARMGRWAWWRQP